VEGGRTARRERGGLLGGKGLCCWAGERWTTVAMLGGRVGGRVVVKELLSGREVNS
jgi:hypothetical protein